MQINFTAYKATPRVYFGGNGPKTPSGDGKKDDKPDNDTVPKKEKVRLLRASLELKPDDPEGMLGMNPDAQGIIAQDAENNPGRIDALERWLRKALRPQQ